MTSSQSSKRGRYRWRTALRGVLPWPLIWLAPKGRDCGAHQRYRQDDRTLGCYHCRSEERALK